METYSFAALDTGNRDIFSCIRRLLTFWRCSVFSTADIVVAVVAVVVVKRGLTLSLIFCKKNSESDQRSYQKNFLFSRKIKRSFFFLQAFSIPLQFIFVIYIIYLLLQKKNLFHLALANGNLSRICLAFHVNIDIEQKVRTKNNKKKPWRPHEEERM